MTEASKDAPSYDLKGPFIRWTSSFRNWIKADGSSDYPAEAGRYHLYVCLACPWANRTIIYRSLKGLEEVISVDVVHWQNTSNGWQFDDSYDGCTKDSQFGSKYLKEIYNRASQKIGAGDYEGRITVPVLFDKKTQTIVNNESSEIIRMLNSEFNEYCATPEQKALDLYPAEHRARIDEVNEWIYPHINNGVYRCGFAGSQEAYDEASQGLFAHLDKLEEMLSKSRYLMGKQLTEADIRLFVTLIRFDKVYTCLFKTNKKRIEDYPNLMGYTRDVYQIPSVKKNIRMDHIVKHYFLSLRTINPLGIIPINPEIDFDAPHGRSQM